MPAPKLYATEVRVHLGNIRRNLQGIRDRIGPDRKMLIAVKADAYGHGAVQVSRMAQESGLVNWLGVATVPEGIELRDAGITLGILKLSPAFPEEMPAALQAGITLAVGDPENVEALQAAAERLGIVAEVHLKVDTGMARVGVQPGDAAELAAFIEDDCPNLYIGGIFTHCPVSDSEAGFEYTEQQLALFSDTVQAVQERIGRTIDLVHASNSGATLGHENGWGTMVRPGIMIYGYYPDHTSVRSVPLCPGMTWATKVSFIKDVEANVSVGYGRTWISEKPTRIATMPVGYADGYARRLSGTGWKVLIRGKEFPLAGRICMDQSMIDLGEDTEVQVGDEVVLIGSQGDAEITCDDYADHLGDTITYEVCCLLGKRVPRYYDLR